MAEQNHVAASQNGGSPLRLSVVIANHNYGRFVGEAIESALAIDWPGVEVIVIDDGSTDESRAVIERYADRAITLFQSNAGQVAACNVGFARSSGDVIIFLDADDRLDPALMRELAPVWHPGVSKVQFQMQIIDGEGRPTGALLPQFKVPPTPERILRWALGAAAYPTPPGSGNAYSRRMLERIFPLDGPDKFADSYCLSAAPFLGDVITVPKPLTSYRIHGSNVGAMTRVAASRLRREVTRSQWRFRYAQQLARDAGHDVDEGAHDRSLHALAYRLASLRLDPAEHPRAGDSLPHLLHLFARAFFVEQGVPLEARSVLLLWALLVSLSPRAAAEHLVNWRFASSSRPQVLRRLLQALRVLDARSASGAPGPSSTSQTVSTPQTRAESQPSAAA